MCIRDSSDRIGLTKKVTVGICGDAKLVAQQLLEQLSPTAGDTDRQKRKDIIHQTKSAWLQKLSSLDHEDDDEGTVWNKEARERDSDRMSPRQAWRAIQAGMPDDVIISSDIGNNCAIGNAYPTFEKLFKSWICICLLYTSPSPRDATLSRMPSSA